MADEPIIRGELNGEQETGGQKNEDGESGVTSMVDESVKAAKFELEDEDEKRKRENGLTPEEKYELLQQAKLFRQGGNDHFRNARYEEAAELYMKAIYACPMEEVTELSVLHSNLAASFMQQNRNDDAILCLNRAIIYDPNYIKAYMRRAKAFESLDKLDEALEDYKKVIEIDPSISDARKACAELPQRISERNERLKAEMMDKLKQLGNMVLRPFGLSTDNFELKQDPATGSYSVNMKK